jgi:hypothetical protein
MYSPIHNSVHKNALNYDNILSCMKVVAKQFSPRFSPILELLLQSSPDSSSPLPLHYLQNRRTPSPTLATKHSSCLVATAQRKLQLVDTLLGLVASAIFGLSSLR